MWALGGLGLTGAAWVLGRMTSQESRQRKERLAERRPRASWKLGGVIVHPRFGVPTLHPQGTLTFALFDEHFEIHRPLGAALCIDAEDLEGVERVRRNLGEPVTRFHRGFDRPRIDLALDDAQHREVHAWWETRTRVERFAWSATEARSLEHRGERLGWALRRNDPMPWLLLRGGAPGLAWRNGLRVERFRGDRRLSHVESRGRSIPVRCEPLGPELATRVRAWPEVAVLEGELDAADLRAQLDGCARPYR